MRTQPGGGMDERQFISYVRSLDPLLMSVEARLALIELLRRCFEAHPPSPPGERPST